jgi:putative endonuclease
MQERWFYAYIVASRTCVLYIGVTSNLENRVSQHKIKFFEGFTADYNCCRLVYYERYASPTSAIAREKQLKGWTRAKKLALIRKMNPTWIDLSEEWGNPCNQSLPRHRKKCRSIRLAPELIQRAKNGALVIGCFAQDDTVFAFVEIREIVMRRRSAPKLTFTPPGPSSLAVPRADHSSSPPTASPHSSTARP